MLQNSGKPLFIVASLAFLYFITGKLSLLFLHGNNIINIGIFAAEGIALGYILYYGKQVWIGIFIGQFILAYSNDIPLAVSLGISATNSLEALIGYGLFKRFHLDIRLKSFRDIYYLIAIILFIQVISAGLGNLLLLLSGIIYSEELLLSGFSWWFGNVMGQLLFTPFVLLTLNYYKKIKATEYFTYIALFAFIVYILETVLSMTNIMILLSVTIPFIVFIVSYKGFVYATAMSVVLALVSSISVYADHGIFQYNNSIDNIINYNLFILVHISIVFITGVLFEERKRNLHLLEEKVAKETNKNKEQQLLLLQQSRLAQMGEMIAMIAHQWRQPLNNLSLANQLLISKYEKGKLTDQTVNVFKENSKKQITHMSKTIDDFRNFFKEEREGANFCINDVITHILSITQTGFENNGIKLTFDTKKVFYSYGYPNELGQAILNIINNARDALADLQQDNKYIHLSLSKKEDMVSILIEDNAGGIPEKLKDKIFDPYFSTKKDKNGTGLGLYMTKMIITEKQNGKIHFTNTEKGVIFEIKLKEVNNAT